MYETDQTTGDGPHIVARAINLPEGGGAIRGIGETFQPNGFTGTADFQIPIPFTPARAFTPDHVIAYNSGNGNGVFGLGFDLNCPDITIRTDKGLPTFTDEDTYILSGSDHLVPELKKSGGSYQIVQRTEQLDGVEYRVRQFRPRSEGLFARIEQWLNTTDRTMHWELHQKDNSLHIFGRSSEARVVDPESPSHIYQWLLEEATDALGNKVVYHYKREDGEGLAHQLSEANRLHASNTYLHKISYGNYLKNGDELFTFQVVMDYGEYDLTDLDALDPEAPSRKWQVRTDPFSTFRPAFEVRTARLCQNILLFHHFEELGPKPLLVKSLSFEYDNESAKKYSDFSLLKKATLKGYQKQGNAWKTESMPSVTLDYTGFDPQAAEFKDMQFEDLELRGYSTKGRFAPVDLYSEGLPGILYSDQETTFYFEPLGNGKYAKPKVPAELPIEKHWLRSKYILQDFDGDGRMELCVHSPERSGYYTVNEDKSWMPFTPYPGFPTAYFEQEMEMLDVDGEGRSDLLINEGQGHVIFYNDGKAGYRAGGRVSKNHDYPSPRRSSEEEITLFANVFGDGLHHRVRLSKGSMEVWPNLGYGKFGPKIQLENVPLFDEEFRKNRVHFADVDGSGTADLIYVNDDRLTVYFNQNGNRFSDGVTIALPQNIDDSDGLYFADINGTNTSSAVLCYNQPDYSHEYYDFAGGKKPYLLNQIDNGMGSLTRMRYRSSVSFYLEDKAAGKPWITQLPFPVQVVDKTEVLDLISGTKLVSTNAYHHGHYDPWEREFRGFGLVEKWDTEDFDQFNQTDLIDAPFEKSEEGFHAVPIYTKTWFHTGVFERSEIVSRHFETTYWQGDPDARKLPDSIFEASDQVIDIESLPQAYRIMRGSILRTEIYGLDADHNPDKVDIPFMVSEANFQIRLLQPQAQNKFAVYQLYPKELITYNYERVADDPRITHAFDLKYDEFGMPLRRCTVAYGRRGGGHPTEQAKLQATGEEFTYINNTTAFYLLSVPETKQTLEIGGLEPDAGEYLSFEAVESHLKRVIDDTPLLPFHQALSGNEAKARLFSWSRFYYWNENQTDAAPLGQCSAQMLLHHTEEAMMTEAGMKDVFSSQISAAKLNAFLSSTDTDGGGYVKKDDYWWNPGETGIYQDQTGYFLMKQVETVYGGITEIVYDNYDLAIVSTTDAVQNQFSATYDYRYITPFSFIDENDNTIEFLYNPFGMLQVASKYGAETSSSDGSVVNRGDAPLAQYNEQPVPDLDSLVANPHDYLQGATSYFMYDYLAWTDRQEPLFAAGIVREIHESELTGNNKSPVQIAIHFTDSMGRSLQMKKIAEGGKALTIDAEGQCVERESEVRWISSGRTIYNNKSKPIKEYEPYYAVSPHYQKESAITQCGVTPILWYDPLERVFQADSPKGYLSKMEFGAWQMKTFDKNDTILDSPYYADRNSLTTEELAILTKTGEHANTPITHLLDVLGREYETQLLKDQSGTPLISRVKFDIQGNELSNKDPRLITTSSNNFETVYDMNKRVLHSDSSDAGETWSILNVNDKLVRSWNSRGFEIRRHYDLIYRPVQVHVKGNGLDQFTEKYIYGEGETDATNKNLNGKLFVRLDQAEGETYSQYTFKGLQQTCQKRFRKNYKEEVSWDNPSSLSLAALMNRELETEEFTSIDSYDALERNQNHEYPDGAKCQKAWHPSNRLKSIGITYADNTSEDILTSISYNARDQRKQIVYGNGVKTTLTYDPKNFTLQTLKTIRESDAQVMQDLSYLYDPMENVCYLKDDSQEAVFSNNQQVDAVANYTYDALYRLISATGREHPALHQNTASVLPDYSQFIQTNGSTNNATILQNYTRNYVYDDSNNLSQMRHTGASSYTRDFTIAATSNRLEKAGTQAISYDQNGSIKELDHLRKVEWNYRDNIAYAVLIERSSGTDDAEYYLYNAMGDRTQKVTEFVENGGTIRKEIKYYFDGYEVKRSYLGTTLKRSSVHHHLKDDDRRVFIHRHILTGKKADEPAESFLFQFHNRIQSCTLELDKTGQISSYEEYFPYGETSFIAGTSQREVKEKEYRYSGKEKDSATGLYYYGARYYPPWLYRWMNPDPAGNIDGLNLYQFVRSNPVTLIDQKGFVGEHLMENREQASSAIWDQTGGRTNWAPTQAQLYWIADTYMRVQKDVYFGRIGMGERPSERVYQLRSEALNRPDGLYFEEGVVQLTANEYAGGFTAYGLNGVNGSNVYHIDDNFMEAARTYLNQHGHNIRGVLPAVPAGRLSYTSTQFTTNATLAAIWEGIRGNFSQSWFDTMIVNPDNGSFTMVDDKFRSPADNQDQFSLAQAQKYMSVLKAVGAYRQNARLDNLMQASLHYLTPAFNLDEQRAMRVAFTRHSSAKMKQANVMCCAYENIDRYGQGPRRDPPGGDDDATMA